MVLYGTTQPNFATFTQTPINCINGTSPPSCNWPSWSPPKFSNATNSGGSGNTVLNGALCLITIGLICGGSVTGVIANTSQAIWNGLLFIGYSLAFFGNALLALFNKIGAMFFLIAGINSELNTDFGVPFVGFVFTGFLIIGIIEFFRMILPGGGGK